MLILGHGHIRNRPEESFMKSTWLLFVILLCPLCACSPVTLSATPTLPVPATAAANPTPLSGAQAAAALAPATATPTSVPTLTRTPALAAQSSATESLTVKAPAPTPTTMAVLRGTFEITSALSALYSSEGLTFTATGLAQFPANESYETSTVKVLVAAPFTENNIEKYALVISQENAWGDCYSCPVPIRMALFARQGETWVAEWRDESELGFAGHAPTGQLVQIGTDRYGFMFIDAETAPGYALHDFELFTVMDGYFRNILSLPYYSESMETAGQPWASWEYAVDYEFVPGKNADYYDLRMTTKGTKTKDGQVVPADASVLYTFQADRSYLGAGYEALSDVPSLSPAQAMATINPPFTLRQALQTLYQPYPGIQVTDKDVLYVPQVYTNPCQPDCCSKCDAPYTTDVISWTVNVILAEPYEEVGRHKLAVLTEWTGFERGDYEGCRTCGGGLGGGIFVQSGNTWLVETKSISNTVDYIGSWGHALDGHLVQIGPNKYGFMFFPYTGGQRGTNVDLNLYAEVAGQIKPIAFFNGFLESYSGFPDQYWPPLGHESVYQFKPGKNPSYYDLYIDTTGACNGEAWLQATCGLRVYTFNGSEYVQTSGPALPTPQSP